MKLLDYSLKTSKIDNGKGYWDYTLCEIYKGESKIGEYTRHYGSYGKETFFAFSFNNKDYALYSANYTKISLMSLPDCKEIQLKEECIEQMANFCPVEIHVPIWASTTCVANNKEYFFQTWAKDLKESEKDEYKYGYCSLAFAIGCVWGDDSSWKFMLIDLSKIEEGEIWFVNNKLEKKWLYSEFPDYGKLENIEVEFEEEHFSTMPSGYKQIVQNDIWFPSKE